MDSSLQSSPGGNLEHKGGFRKPSTDTATRNYRKRSPVDRSPSSDGDPEHDNSYSPKHAKQDSTGRDYLDRKKDDEKEVRKDSDRSRYGKSGDSHRYSERNASRSYHGQEKFSDGDRQSKEASFSDQRTRQYDHSKSRDKDKYSRDRYESSGHRSKDREKEAASSEYQKYRDKICPRSESGRGREDRGEKRDNQRSSRNHRSGREIEESITADRANSRDRAKGHYESGDVRENQRIVKERDVDDSDVLREKGQSGRVGKSLDDKSVPDRDQKSPSKKSRFSSYGSPDFVKSSSDARKQESLEGNGNANPGQLHGANDLNAAKFAAMKAAELVNQNLGGGAGFMSTEQKKKLLWGNKKSSVATEESARQWDVSSIGDPERQEKFNKLMNLSLCGNPSWPIVGCEGGQWHQQGRQQHCSSREAQRTADRSREAVHCWATKKGWQNRRPRSLGSPFGTTMYSSLKPPLNSKATPGISCQFVLGYSETFCDCSSKTYYVFMPILPQ